MNYKILLFSLLSTFCCQIYSMENSRNSVLALSSISTVEEYSKLSDEDNIYMDTILHSNRVLALRALTCAQSIDKLLGGQMEIDALSVYRIPSVFELAPLLIIRCQQKLNEILNEINFSDDKGVYSRIITRILEDITKNNDLEHFFYAQLNSLQDKITDYSDISQKIIICKTFLYDILEFNLGVLTFTNLPTNMNQNRNIETWLNCMPYLIKHFIDGIDLFDNWLLYAKNNNLHNFEQYFFNK